jgi:predicted HicB family RNase H-like nuclease
LDTNNGKKVKWLYTRVDPDFHAAVKAFAKINGISMERLVRSLLKDVLEKAGLLEVEAKSE